MDEESESRPFEPSSVNEAVLQSSVLDPSAYSHDVDRTVQEFDEADFQSEWEGAWATFIKGFIYLSFPVA